MTVILGRAQNDAREKVWKMIRCLIAFSFEEVSILTELPYTLASSYLKALYQAGYIRQAGKRREADGRKKVIWRVARNTGPKAPVPCKCLYDPNIDELSEVKVPPPKLRGGKREISEAGHVD